MIIKLEPDQERSARVAQWHPYFAWFRIVNGGVVFFEWIERRWESSWGDGWWVYRLKGWQE